MSCGDELRAIATRVHVCVGADIAAVVREAGTLALLLYHHLCPRRCSTDVRRPHVRTSIHPSVLQHSASTLYPLKKMLRFVGIGGRAHTIAAL